MCQLAMLRHLSTVPWDWKWAIATKISRNLYIINMSQNKFCPEYPSNIGAVARIMSIIIRFTCCNKVERDELNMSYLNCFPLTLQTAMRTLISREKRRLIFIKPITWAYCPPLLYNILAAARFMTSVQLGPEPPVVKKTRGSNDSFSVFKILSFLLLVSYI